LALQISKYQLFVTNYQETVELAKVEKDHFMGQIKMLESYLTNYQEAVEMAMVEKDCYTSQVRMLESKRVEDQKKILDVEKQKEHMNEENLRLRREKEIIKSDSEEKEQKIAELKYELEKQKISIEKDQNSCKVLVDELIEDLNSQKEMQLLYLQEIQERDNLIGELQKKGEDVK